MCQLWSQHDATTTRGGASGSTFLFLGQKSSPNSTEQNRLGVVVVVGMTGILVIREKKKTMLTRPPSSHTQKDLVCSMPWQQSISSLRNLCANGKAEIDWAKHFFYRVLLRTGTTTPLPYLTRQCNPMQCNAIQSNPVIKLNHSSYPVS